jgi:hypothetical protein
MTVERKIPNRLDSAILFPLFGRERKTPETYVKKLEKFERDCEKSLIETLSKVGTLAMVKTNPYSLPYTDELSSTLYAESYLNGPYEFYRPARAFVREVIDRNLWKVRFYIKIDILTEKEDGESPFFMGKIIYRFRYYNKQ